MTAHIYATKLPITYGYNDQGIKDMMLMSAHHSILRENQMVG